MNKINNKSRKEIESIIDAWILNERNRRILFRRFIDGVTLERLAEEFELSTRQINTIVKKGLDAILAHV